MKRLFQAENKMVIDSGVSSQDLEGQDQSAETGDGSGEGRVRHVITAAEDAPVVVCDEAPGVWGRGFRRCGFLGWGSGRRGFRRRGIGGCGFDHRGGVLGGGRGCAGPGRSWRRTGEALVSVDSWGGEGDKARPASPGDAADPVLVLGDARVDPVEAGLAAVLTVANNPALDPGVSAAVFAHQRTPRVPLEGDGHVTSAGTPPDPEPPPSLPPFTHLPGRRPSLPLSLRHTSCCPSSPGGNIRTRCSPPPPPSPPGGC